MYLFRSISINGRNLSQQYRINKIETICARPAAAAVAVPVV